MEVSNRITVNNLSKSYKVKTSTAIFQPTFKHIEAVKGISFTHDTGNNLGILGKNGAGKTTLIKMLTGILHPDNGTIDVLGHTPKLLTKDYKCSIG